MSQLVREGISPFFGIDICQWRTQAATSFRKRGPAGQKWDEGLCFHDGKSRLSIMESNFEKKSPQDLPAGNPAPVSPDDAARAIAVIAADQAALRKAVVPPKWYLVVLSICIGGLFAKYAIPESPWWFETLRACLSVAILVVLVLLIVWLGRHRTVRAGFGKILFPLRPGLIPMIVLFAAVIALACVEPVSVLPWWGHVCIGICVGAAAYLIARWTWRTWSEAQSR